MSIAELARKANSLWGQENVGDYRNEAGILMCGKCHTAKEVDFSDADARWPVRRVFCICHCEQEKLRRRGKAAEQKRRVEKLREAGIAGEMHRQFRFEADDKRLASVSDACRTYVECWEKARAENIGLLLYGDVGTGKTFYACCVANALIDAGVSVLVTSMPLMMERLRDSYDVERRWMMDDVRGKDLLVIDDFGVERETPFALEQAYYVVNARQVAGKPLVITTNVSVDFMREATETYQRRIYDRVLEMCAVQMRLTGASRRAENGKRKVEGMVRALRERE